MRNPYRWARSRTEHDTWILRRGGVELAIAARLGSTTFYWYPIANELPTCQLELQQRRRSTIEEAKADALAWVRTAQVRP